MRRPPHPIRLRSMTRAVAVLLVVIIAAGATVAPSSAAVGGGHLCLVALFGPDCGAGLNGTAVAATSCCEQHPTDPKQDPAAHGEESSETCPCPCSHCCLPLGRAPATVSTSNPVSRSMQPAFSPVAAPVLSRPAGVHTSVFHPPRA